MIIWIDGTYGVGKTTVAEKLCDLFGSSPPLVLHSDEYWQTFLKSSCRGGGCFPQNNTAFINEFKSIILDCLNEDCKLLIVDMALTDKKCRDGLLNELVATDIDILHFILDADNQIIRNRILSDEVREQKEQHIRAIIPNKTFLSENYKGAIWIDTGKVSPAEEIYRIYIESQKYKATAEYLC